MSLGYAGLSVDELGGLSVDGFAGQACGAPGEAFEGFDLGVKSRADPVPAEVHGGRVIRRWYSGNLLAYVSRQVGIS